MMNVVLITGGIGSGKSVVSEYLRSMGIPVYDTDSRTKALYDIDMNLSRQLESLIGTTLRSPDGKFDRKKFAEAIFSSGNLLPEVEKIVHPAVLEDFRQWCNQLSARSRFVCMESAIALEKPLFIGTYQIVVMVDAPEGIRLARACSRDGASKDAIQARMRKQHLDYSKADYIIENIGSKSELEKKTIEVFRQIAERFAARKNTMKI